MKLQLSPRTVIEAFLPFEGEAPLADIYDTANLAGIADQPVRLAVRRLIVAGDITQHGRGRAGTLILTSAGRQRLEFDRQSLAFAFAQDAGHAPWDGQWRMIAVSVPERERSIRDSIRRILVDAGAVTVSTGLYLSPHELLESLPPQAHTYLTMATTANLNYQGTTDPIEIAEALWPAGPIFDAYSAISETLHDLSIDTSVVAPVRQLYLADALERAMRHDPLVPLELRNGTWLPRAIRAEWVEQWESEWKASEGAIFQGWWPTDTQNM
ncbi:MULTISPECIES: PaaX family transcriptional regulator [Brevibacterium]|uniref:Phenylacetic acid degradation operon negative regulatory protein n=1 Tax=Brevibacterium aurantiacum TaxID=273384 RepID=A0A2H1IED7_BREAU|nr:PaaX family transcriptional regulator [Brevibacterium aurantiacum]SMX73589.1 phenylacetic acid degradation operon negative regulatory protein [Brevibacterium aurantiacum]